jgi:predicted 2-oxoglutarate/Fe(II)-dependent dioxygenase YbiX/peroxiredoxin
MAAASAQSAPGRVPPRRAPLPLEPAPWFSGRCGTKEQFTFDTLAGRYVVLCFFGSAANPLSRSVLDGLIQTCRPLFDDANVCFFGISTDPEDERQQRLSEMMPGIRYFWDTDSRISRLYGRLDADRYLPATILIDERLRLYDVLPFGDDAAAHVAAVAALLAAVPPLSEVGEARVQAPVLLLPRVFEPSLCQALIAYYQRWGGGDSGFMREVDGMTVGVVDHSHKRRQDKLIEDQELRMACLTRIHDRVVPEIKKAFQFDATRIERHLIACYEGADGGHFRPHRDNTTRGTAHRRFAVSLVLNSGDFEGGMLQFPEFGRQLYSPPAGGAVIFSCSLLHGVTPVRRGSRYCYLPFLYDNAAAELRERNQRFLAQPSADPDRHRHPPEAPDSQG